uniref:Uncharacterized protein n=1 Tax=Meloidogyne incognita TaxID=6306 RepID=A0A914MNV6_MELIC
MEPPVSSHRSTMVLVHAFIENSPSEGLNTKKPLKLVLTTFQNVAQPDEMFDGGVCKSKSELHKEIDPYIDSETGMLPKCTDTIVGFFHFLVSSIVRINN